jgi:hypothetical protein
MTPPTSSPAVHAAIRAGVLGMVKTPMQGNVLIDGCTWMADNGCFGSGYPGDDEWMKWLGKLRQHAGRCLFATAPDVLGDAKATLVRSAPWLGRIRGLGFKAALVAQDGLEDVVDEVPWDHFDVLFIGGSTDWKLGPGPRYLAWKARLYGKGLHLGRVNSQKRYTYARLALGGCGSVDGTFLTFGPDFRLPEALAWVASSKATTSTPQGERHG